MSEQVSDQVSEHMSQSVSEWVSRRGECLREYAGVREGADVLANVWVGVNKRLSAQALSS